MLKSFLDGLTCRDLQQLLDYESFKPQVYTTFIKLLNEMHAIRADCSEMLKEIFEEGERMPQWASNSVGA